MKWLKRVGYALTVLVAVNRLHAADPELHMMPRHDAAAIDSFVKSGLLAKGF